jgi:hypothetical protein
VLRDAHSSDEAGGWTDDASRPAPAWQICQAGLSIAGTIFAGRDGLTSRAKRTGEQSRTNADADAFARAAMQVIGPAFFARMAGVLRAKC